jgi:hypothetical protein
MGGDLESETEEELNDDLDGELYRGRGRLDSRP